MVNAAQASIQQNDTGKVYFNFEEFSGWLVSYRQGNVIPIIASNYC